jgi:hypothetical protein
VVSRWNAARRNVVTSICTGTSLPTRAESECVRRVGRRPERSALAYHAKCPAGYVPPGTYVVQTQLGPDLKSGTTWPDLSKWPVVRREMYIGTNLEIVFKLSPAN